MLRQPSTRYRYERILKASPHSTTILVRDQSNRLLVLKRGPSVPSEAHLLLKFTNHPHIVQLVEGPFEDDLHRPSMIMEYCEGGDLEQWAGSKEKGERAMVCLEVMLQVAKALVDIHSAGVMHRDLKPRNVFVHHFENHKIHVKIGDFGVSREADLAETALGTPLYLSPEQVRGLPYSSPADIWALGCVIYELITGQPPFAAKKSLRDLMHSICKSEVSLVDVEGVPEVVCKLTVECLYKDPRMRPTAGVIVERLQKARGIDKMSRDQAITLLKTKFGETICSNILSSLKDCTITSKYDKIVFDEFTIIDPPKTHSALIHRIVRLRRELQSVIAEDDKMDLAIALIGAKIMEEEFERRIGKVLFEKVLEGDYLLKLKELSVLESDQFGC